MVLSPFAILLPSFVCSVLLLAFVCVYLSKARQQHSNSFRMIIRTSQIMDNTRGRHARTHSNECQILFLQGSCSYVVTYDWKARLQPQHKTALRIITCISVRFWREIYWRIEEKSMNQCHTNNASPSYPNPIRYTLRV